MAEDLPHSIDDGELWPPSDVIRALGVCRHHQHHLPGRLTAMDDLAQKLACLDILERRRAIPTVKPFKDSNFYPEVQFQVQGRAFSSLSPANGGYRAPISRRVAAADWTAPYLPVPKTVHKFDPALPVDSHVERLRLANARVLQRQRQQNGPLLLNRFIPTRPTGSGRENGGTGVFLPRVYRDDSKNKPSNMKGNSQLQQSMRNPVMGKQSVFLPSSGTGLPHDWTY